MTTNNHPADGPVSLERLHQISETLSKAAAQSDGGNLGYAMADAVKVIDEVLERRQADNPPVHPTIADEKLDDETLQELIEFRRSTFEYHSKEGNKVKTIIHGVVLSALLELQERRAAMLQAGNSTSKCSLRDGIEAIRNSGISVDVDKIQSECEAGNSPVTQDGYVLVPKKLTAENGAKSVLSGEFSETKFINCPECFGDDDCETCDGSGRIEITVPVTWTTIKAIWAKGVEHFAAAPQQEVK